MTNTDLEKAVAESGFPMQIGIEGLVRESGIRWRVVGSEHPWRDPATQDDKFIDLVLQADPGLTLIVECKRAKETDLIFLQKTGEANRNRRIARSWVTSLRPGGACNVNEWTDTPFTPASPLAEFCVIRKNHQRSQELLERTASELVRATEAVALQDATIGKRRNIRLGRIYTPVIVTTATIINCTLSHENFDPLSGEIPNGTFEAVPYVRFGKTMSIPETYDKVEDLADFATQSERSVFVVHSSSFLDFLKRLDFSGGGELLRELWG